MQPVEGFYIRLDEYSRRILAILLLTLNLKIVELKWFVGAYSERKRNYNNTAHSEATHCCWPPSNKPPSSYHEDSLEIIPFKQGVCMNWNEDDDIIFFLNRVYCSCSPTSLLVRLRYNFAPGFAVRRRNLFRWKGLGLGSMVGIARGSIALMLLSSLGSTLRYEFRLPTLQVLQRKAQSYSSIHVQGRYLVVTFTSIVAGIMVCYFQAAHSPARRTQDVRSVLYTPQGQIAHHAFRQRVMIAMHSAHGLLGTPQSCRDTWSNFNGNVGILTASGAIDARIAHV